MVMSKKHKRSQKALHLNKWKQMIGFNGNNLKFVNGNLKRIDFMFSKFLKKCIGSGNILFKAIQIKLLKLSWK